MSVTGLPTEARAKSRRAKVGGEAGIRTLGTTFRSYNGLANRRLQPLGHLTTLNLLRNSRVSPIAQLRPADCPRLCPVVPREADIASRGLSIIASKSLA